MPRSRRHSVAASAFSMTVALLAVSACTGDGAAEPPPVPAPSVSPAVPSRSPGDVWPDPDFGVRNGFQFINGLCEELAWDSFALIGELQPTFDDAYEPGAGLIRCWRDILGRQRQVIGSVQLEILIRPTDEQAETIYADNAGSYGVEPIDTEKWDEAGAGTKTFDGSSEKYYAFVGRDNTFTIVVSLNLDADLAADQDEQDTLALVAQLANEAWEWSRAS